MVEKIKHISIVFVLPTILVFKHLKTCSTQHVHILAGGPMLLGPPGNCPVCTCVKVAVAMMAIRVRNKERK
jgi:hypothetical protein